MLDYDEDEDDSVFTGPFARRLWAIWLTLPATALSFRLAWDRLPARLPTHRGMSGRVDAWGSRSDVFALNMGIMAFVLVTLTAVGYFVRFMRPDRSRPVLFVMYFVAGVGLLVQSWFIWSAALGRG